MSTKSPDFRFVYANAIALGMSDHEIHITFAFAEDMRKPDDNTEQVGVVMTHQTAKWLLNVLRETIDHFERATGNTIPFDLERFETLKNLATSTSDQNSNGDLPHS